MQIHRFWTGANGLEQQVVTTFDLPGWPICIATRRGDSSFVIVHALPGFIESELRLIDPITGSTELLMELDRYVRSCDLVSARGGYYLASDFELLRLDPLRGSFEVVLDSTSNTVGVAFHDDMVLALTVNEDEWIVQVVDPLTGSTEELASLEPI